MVDEQAKNMMKCFLYLGGNGTKLEEGEIVALVNFKTDQIIEEGGWIIK
jgi:hypothetical protein